MQIGIVDHRFLAKSIGSLNPPAPMVVKNTDSIFYGIKLLKENKIGCLTIVDAQGKVVGIFSERDVLLKISLSSLDIEATKISEVMTQNPQTATMTSSIAFILNMMSHGGYRNVPIVDDDNCPVGIVNVKHVVDYIANSLSKDLVSFT